MLAPAFDTTRMLMVPAAARARPNPEARKPMSATYPALILRSFTSSNASKSSDRTPPPTELSNQCRGVIVLTASGKFSNSRPGIMCKNMLLVALQAKLRPLSLPKIGTLLVP